MNKKDELELLFNVCMFTGKAKEAQRVVQTLVQMYPEEAGYHLLLGNMFFTALCNDKRPPGDAIQSLRQLVKATGQPGAKVLETLRHKDPRLYKALTDEKYEPPCEDLANQITLEALGCSYEFA